MAGYIGIMGSTGSKTGFDPVTDMQIERLLDVSSPATSQLPTGLGDANAVKITFGAGSGTIADPVMVDNTGKLTINEAGTYRI